MVNKSGLIFEWDTFLATATLPPRSDNHGGCTDEGVPASSPTEEADEELHGLAGVLGVLAGRGGGPGLLLVLRITGLLGCDLFIEWVGDGEEGRESGAWRRPLAIRSLDFLAGTGGGTGGFLGWVRMILSPLDSGGLVAGLDSSSGTVGDRGAGHAGRRGSCKGTGGLDLGLSAGAPLRVVFFELLMSDFALSKDSLNSALGSLL